MADEIITTSYRSGTWVIWLPQNIILADGEQIVIRVATTPDGWAAEHIRVGGKRDPMVVEYKPHATLPLEDVPPLPGGVG